jgi:hypothetical protein
MSVRYTPIALGLLAWELLPVVTRRPDRVRTLVATLAPVAALGALLVWWYLYAFGTLSLTRIYRSANAEANHGALAVYVRSVGAFLDPIGGLLPYAPVLILGVIGLGALWRGHRQAVIVAFATALVYLAFFAPAGFRGYALPGRLAIVAMPVLAIGVGALASAFPRVALALIAVLGLLTLAITIESAHRATYQRLYRAEPLPAAPLVGHEAGLFPNFRPEPGGASFSLKTTPAAARTRLVQLQHGNWDVRISPPTGVTVWRTPVIWTPPKSAAQSATPEFGLRVGRSGTIYAFETDGGTHVITGTRLGAPRNPDDAVHHDYWVTIVWILVLLGGAVLVAWLTTRQRPRDPEPNDDVCAETGAIAPVAAQTG